MHQPKSTITIHSKQMNPEAWHISANGDNNNIVVRNERREIVADFETDELVSKREARERAALVALAPQMLSLLRQLNAKSPNCEIYHFLSRLEGASKPLKYAIWWTNGETSEIIELKEFLSREDADEYAQSQDFEDNEYWAELAE
jgi:hypothetical protein